MKSHQKYFLGEFFSNDYPRLIHDVVLDVHHLRKYRKDTLPTCFFSSNFVVAYTRKSIRIFGELNGNKISFLKGWLAQNMNLQSQNNRIRVNEFRVRIMPIFQVLAFRAKFDLVLVS